MSGSKRVPMTIYQDEWNNLNNRIQTSERTVAESRQRETEALRQQQLLQNQLNEMLRNNTALNVRLEETARNAEAKIERQRIEFQQALQNESADIKDIIRRQRLELEIEIENSHNELQSQINDMQSQMDARNVKEREAATHWQREATRVLDTIRTYAHLPNYQIYIAQIERELNFGVQDMNAGLSAVSSFRNAFVQASDAQIRLRIDEEMRVREWVSARQVFAETELRLQDARAYAVEIDSTRIPISVDEFTGGRLTQIANRVAELQGFNEKQPQEYYSQRIEEMLTIQREIEQLQNSARNNCVAVHHRLSRFERLNQVLEAHNFRVVDGDNDVFNIENNMLNELNFYFVNLLGDRIFGSIALDGTLEYHTHFDSLRGNEEDIDDKQREVMAWMREAGFDIGAHTTLDNSHGRNATPERTINFERQRSNSGRRRRG